MKRVLCFGEILLRFSPTGNGEWLNNGQMPVYLGGAELNVATALARWEVPVSYCTVMPDNFLSQDLMAELKRRNLNIDTIRLSGERLGSYYLAQGKDLKNRSVVYDREHSSFGELKPGVIDWDHALKDIFWLHLSTISPALSEAVAEVCEEALEAASRRNITVSIDLNHRAALWKQRNPEESMSKLLNHCEVVMGNIWSAHDLVGIPLDSTLLQQNEAAYRQRAQQSAQTLMKRFPRIKTVALTFRFDEGERRIQYFAFLLRRTAASNHPSYAAVKSLTG